MISEENLKETAKSLMGSYMAVEFPYDKVAGRLHAFEEAHSIELSPYGYVMWAVDHYGYKCAYRNLMASAEVQDGYASAALKYRDDMPALLDVANVYVNQLMSNVADMDTCFSQLEGMSFPYVLYILFAGSGMQDVVERYRPEAAEQLRRYPSTLDLLGESYRNAGKEVLYADSDKS